MDAIAERIAEAERLGRAAYAAGKRAPALDAGCRELIKGATHTGTLDILEAWWRGYKAARAGDASLRCTQCGAHCETGLIDGLCTPCWIKKG